MEDPAMGRGKKSAARVALGVPESLARPLAAFLKKEKIELEVTVSAEATVRVEQAEHPAPSGMKTLQAGGWIACPIALALAPRLGIGSKELGKILDFLKIKVRDCGLGCF